MRKTRKGFISVILIMTMFISTLPIVASAEITESGTCGDNLTWTLDDEGTLTISGEGDMTDWRSFADVPWFSSRMSITSIVISDNITHIGNRAFASCPHLTGITIPDSVISIGDHAFYGWSSLTYITIPNSVTNIGDNAFQNCSHLTSITIPDSVIIIGDYAFDGCTDLTSAVIGNNVTSIGWNVFNSTEIYNNVDNWQDRVLYIGNYLISAKTDISGEYTIKDDTRCIAQGAFANCQQLTNIILPDHIESISEGMFQNCRSLESIVIPNSVTSIGSYAFWKCDSLTGIQIPNAVTSIEADTFRECANLVSIFIPDTITSVECSAFYKTGIYNNADNWQDGILYIEDYLICANTNISGGLTIKDGVHCIAKYAFSWCDNLTSIAVPDSMTDIGDYAFSDTYNLSDVYYNGSEEQWNRINIGTKNSYLDKAVFHYNRNEIPTPSVEAVDVTNSENEYTFTISLADIPYNCELIAVLYSDTDVMSGVGNENITSADTEKTITISGNNATTAKLYIWDSLSGMKPLCEAQEIPIE